MDLQAILDEATQHLDDITRAAQADGETLQRLTGDLRAAEAEYERQEAEMDAELAELSTKTTEAFLAYAEALEKK